LKIEQNYLEDHQLEVTVEADEEAFEKAKHKAARDLAKGKKIPGYRPGKAPYQLVLNYFGEGAIIDRAIEHLLDEVYPQVIEEVDQEPYGPGQVKEIKTLEPPTFIFNIPLQPEVTLGEYRELRLPFESSSLPGERVDEVIDHMRGQQATVEAVDHPAEEGTLVDTSLDCRPVNSDASDDEVYLLKNQPLPVMIKKKKDDNSKEWPFPGFSRQLLGSSAGDTLELTHQFADEETVAEDYRGREMLYTVAVGGIRQRVLPELNDEFVQSVSEFKTVKELRENIQEELTKQQELEDENRYINQILEAIVQDAEIKFPPQMLENEVEGEIQELEDRLKSQGMDLEMYLGIQEMNEEELRHQIKPGAEKRITQGLVIGKISEAEDFNIKPEEITGEFKRILDDHFGDDEKGRTEYLKSGESVALLNRVSSQYITRKTLDFLKAVASGEDFSTFLKQEDEEDKEVEEKEVKETKLETSPESNEGEPDTAVPAPEELDASSENDA
jgi:trigger factor